MSVPAAYVGVIIIWSTTPLAIKWSSEGGGFLFGVSARMIIGALVCLAIMGALSRPLPWHREARRTYFAAATGIYGAMMSVYWGAQFIPSGLISVLFGLTPILVSVMASLWLGERSMSPLKFAGMGLGVAGLAVLFHSGIALGPQAAMGIGALLLSVTIHSASTVWVKRIGASIPAMAVVGGALLTVMPMYLLTWLVFDGRLPSNLTARAALSIGYLSVFGSVLGFIMYFYVLKRMDASRLALITLVTPVIALLLGRQFNDEIITGREWLGTAIILLGLVLHQWSEWWGLRRAAALGSVAPAPDMAAGAMEAEQVEEAG